MNQKKFNKNITGTQTSDVLDVSESIMQQNRSRFLSYKFEIIDDENIYSISFNGELTEEEARKMLESIQNCLYEKISDAIQIYLEQSNLAYSGFITSKKPLEHSRTIELAKMFLHSENSSNIDNYIGNTNVYYAIMDHQQLDNKNNCEGCYIVIQKTPALSKCQHKYNIIGQTFNYNETTDDEYGYFAIRKTKGNGLIDNIALSSWETVLLSFGCIDLAALLLNIDGIQTAKQAVQFAVK